MEMKDVKKEVTYKEANRTHIIDINLKIPEELLIKIYDKIRETYEKTGYHPHLLILSQEYARWFKELLNINEYTKLRFNSIARFNGLEIKVTFKEDTIEVY
jgi:hypothetical protein